ncbi:MAG TPA: MOSC N-terminal beta barrel domain-containing protein [Saprospiraceae bacterium]|nr:MOSC N-terminal beta barrel domain-containing protein [Saprospiraceae bacterium]
MIQLTDIKIYPIKSLAGISVASASVEPKGLALDRRWMLVDNQGRFLSQRKDPQMALLHLEWHTAAQEILRISHRKKTLPPLLLPLEIKLSEERIKVSIWDDELMAIPLGQGYDEWFSRALDRNCRLVYMPSSDRRPVDPDYAQAEDSVSFADGFPYLLANHASLQDLNERLRTPITMDRFRANLIIEGTEAWAEDSWTSFKIGEVVFRSLKPCARCVLITVDPATGEKSPEPLKTLSRFRKSGNKVLFGINACWNLESGSELKVGDQVEPKILGI